MGLFGCIPVRGLDLHMVIASVPVSCHGEECLAPYSYCTYPRRFCCFQSSDAASHSPYHRLISLPPSSHHHLELSYSDRLNYTWELLEAFLGSLQRVPDEVCKDIVVILASSKGPPIWVDSLQLWLQVGCVTKSKRSAGMCVWYFTIILAHLCLALP